MDTIQIIFTIVEEESDRYKISAHHPSGSLLDEDTRVSLSEVDGVAGEIIRTEIIRQLENSVT